MMLLASDRVVIWKREVTVAKQQSKKFNMRDEHIPRIEIKEFRLLITKEEKII